MALLYKKSASRDLKFNFFPVFFVFNSSNIQFNINFLKSVLSPRAKMPLSAHLETFVSVIFPQFLKLYLSNFVREILIISFIWSKIFKFCKSFWIFFTLGSSYFFGPSPWWSSSSVLIRGAALGLFSQGSGSF